MKKAFAMFSLFLVLIAGRAACSPAAEKEKPTLRFLISSSFYDLKADAGWEVASASAATRSISRCCRAPNS